MSYVSPLYCTDEDLAVRAVGDFSRLCPHWQRLASGTDGVVAGDDLWTLSSPAVNFYLAGVAVGSIFLLTHNTINRYGSSGSLYAVSSVSSTTGSVTLRNVGMAAGVGVAPAPAGGMTSIRFEVPTLGPQIEEVSYRINRDYGIDAIDPDREPTDLYDARELRELCVLMVLKDQYTIENRSETGDYKVKGEKMEQELDALVPRLKLRWGPTGEDAPPGGSFSTRYYR
jgi:hypothetical protein